jgi:tetratricopeptide (TPR) repeat protein
MAAHLNEFGVLCKYWGRFDEGERAYLRALGILEREFGKDALETATLYHNLGGLEHTRGDYAKGEPLGRKAYEIRRAALGDEAEPALADAVAWGGLLDGLERYDESVPIYRRALAYYEKRFGETHFETAATLNNLGLARAAQGDLEEARHLLGRCLATKRKLFAEDHPEVQLTRRNLESLDE